MSRFLTAALLGGLIAAAPAAAEPHERDRDRPASPASWALVDSWYQRFLHRAPDPSAVSWARTLDRGANPEKTVSALIASDEFYRAAGSTPQGFVLTLFRNLNGRDPSRAEFGFWLGRMALSPGEAPGFDERSDAAYAMLMRYPQNWQAPPPDFVPNRPDDDHDRHDIDRDRRHYDRDDDYDYRRPVYPGYHRDEHDAPRPDGPRP